VDDNAVNRQWFVAKTKPRREFQTKDVLMDRGIEVYLPEIRRRSRRGVSGSHGKPLFPGYLFVYLSLATSEWVVARSAPGVAYFLGTAGAPTAVPADLVNAIRARSELLLQNGWYSSFQAGDRVRFERGPFVGLEAVFDRPMSPAGRVRVLLEVVRRLVPVDLDADDLRHMG
jgi:transcriptional antiterminator RfaH